MQATLLRNSAASLLIKLTSVLLGFVLAVLLARGLGPEQYGIYGFILTLVTMIAIPAQVGLPNLVVRETARAGGREDWALMRGIWRWSSRYVLTTSLLLLTVVAIALYFAGDLLTADRHRALVLALPLIPLIALGNIRGAALRGLRRVVLGLLPEKIIRTVLLIALIGSLFLIGGNNFTASTALKLYVVSALVAFVVGAWLLWRARPHQLKKEANVKVTGPEWRRAVLPLALIGAAQLLNTNIDMLLLGVLRSDAEVGLYRVVVQLGQLVIFGLTAINMVLHPSIARLHQQGDLKGLQRVVTTSARMIFLIALPPAIVFIVFGEWVLTMAFGEEYAPAKTALAILVVGQLVNAGMGSVGALLNMTGHERDTMRAMLVAVVINIALNVALIPRFGIEGAAFSTSFSFVIWNVMLWRMVWKRLKIRSTAIPGL